ncbi:MAG: ShlB/FhaC/HecB family hemolysin secretion/activation protein [Rhodoferax sp.]|nr:ShlB/FhaC/HecB family hemolysin secretion/activation protein [Rhodoferax sp.]
MKHHLLPLVICVSTGVGAQTQAPNAGQILRENAPKASPAGAGSKILSPVVPMAGNEGLPSEKGTVSIKTVKFSGNKGISDEELWAQVPGLSAVRGNTLTLGQLRQIEAAITRYYRSRGYVLAMAYTPPQTMKDGVLEIAVLEGKVEKIVVGESGSYSPERIKKVVQAALCDQSTSDCTGAVLEKNRIDRAIGLVSDLPGVSAGRVTLSPGKALGTTVYGVSVTPQKAITARVEADNFGNRYTDENRYQANVEFNNLGGWGDRVVTHLLATGDKLAIAGVDASVAAGYSGLRAGALYSGLRYKLGAPFDALEASGTGDVASLYASYPLVRRESSTLNIRTDIQKKWLSDSMSSFDSTQNKNSLGWKLAVNGVMTDNFWNGGETQADLAWEQGNMVYDYPLNAANTKDGSGRYSKLSYTLSRDQSLLFSNGGRWSAFASVRGQATQRNLDASNGIALGGAQGVRAYPSGEAPGDMGAIANMELRYTTPLVAGSNTLVEWTLFRDMGWLKTNYSLPFAGYTGAGDRMLKGYGLGVSLSQRDRYRLSLVLAQRDQDSPEPTSAPDAMERYWLNFSVYF